MPRSPQDIYARHLLSPRGYPLWRPDPSRQFLAYRREGLRIGDVGVVVPENGSFDVYFNLCLPHDHPFHQATGVPDNFEPIRLSEMDISTTTNAENPGRIIATSSVKTARIERSADTSSRTRSSTLEYEFNLSSNEGALLILPDGAECEDLRNHNIFLEAAAQHGADWYRFAEEKVGRIIGNDSLYLITGLYKTLSWSVAAFEETEGSEEYPARCRLPQLGRGNITTTCTWNTTRALDWRVGPDVDNNGIPNQTVFIRGFKIAQRTRIFGRWISVKADVPSTRSSGVNYSSAARRSTRWNNVFGGQLGDRGVGSSGGDMQDEIAADPDPHANETQSHGALVVSKDIIIQRVPEASQAFHPSDIINQYLLNEEPSANIAITHDDEWIVLLEKNMLRSEDFAQEGLLKELVSDNYHVVSDTGAVYLRSKSAPLVIGLHENPSLNRNLSVSNAIGVDTTTGIQKHGSKNAVDEISSEQEHRSEIRTSMPPSLNIILFEESGAAKSSVINLMAGKKIADKSHDTRGCTLESKQYTFETTKRTFNIWDTIGLREPTLSVSNCLGAIEKTHELMRQIEAHGGLDLLLFCMPGTWVTETMQYNYKLFFEVLCEKRIPIAAVVTRLEDEDRMEDWWDRNKEYIRGGGMNFDGHACITVKRDHAKAAESLFALELLLRDYEDQHRYPMPPIADWFSGFLERLPSIPRSKELKDKQKELERLLVKCCNMDPAEVKQLARTITHSSAQD